MGIMSRKTEETSADHPVLYGWMWSWHGYAGLFVIPFIFFMALTGLPFVWDHDIENAFHPEYRALTPGAERVSYQSQLETARRVYPDKPLLSITADGDPRHATQFLFGTSTYPYSVYVNPYTGAVITHFSEWLRLSTAGILMHGLVVIKPYGSWLLEFLACWGIILCASGVYLWWPRGQRKVWGVFLPRLRGDKITMVRDLHVVVGFYFVLLLALYLMTGLPWTAFWGGKLLTSFQNAIGQPYPVVMTADSGLKSLRPTTDAKPLPLDSFLAFGFSRHLPGNLNVELPTDDKGTVHLYNETRKGMSEIHYHLDLYTAQPLASASWNDMPSSQKIVRLGIDLHEGSLFGRITQISSTLLALIFMGIAGASALLWWMRRPKNLPSFRFPESAGKLPGSVVVILVILGLSMPLAGLSMVLFLFYQRFRSHRPAIASSPTL